jgi:antitoxin (DNA-binding transcriptional repressor) of toxin-antitoxin stability system
MKTVTLNKLRTRLDSILRMVAEGEEIQIVEKRKAVARLVPPVPEEADWSETFAKLDEIWGRKPLPGDAGSEIVIEGRR